MNTETFVVSLSRIRVRSGKCVTPVDVIAAVQKVSAVTSRRCCCCATEVMKSRDVDHPADSMGPDYMILYTVVMCMDILVDCTELY